MRTNYLLSGICFCCLLLSTACGDYDKTEQSLDAKDRSYLRQLGLLDDSEKVLRFEGSDTPFHQSGSFFTDKRIAGYWVEDDKKETHSAFYRDIDSLTLTDKTRAVTLASYLTVYPSDQSPFHVYIDLDSTGIYSFFEAAKLAWKRYR